MYAGRGEGEISGGQTYNRCLGEHYKREKCEQVVKKRIRYHIILQLFHIQWKWIVEWVKCGTLQWSGPKISE